MHGLHQLESYSLAQEEYAKNDDWKCFRNAHLEKAHFKCPICEVKLDNSAERTSKKGAPVTIVATIDHYRPTKLYEFLKNEHTNFIMMCLDCNNHYKQHKFPLYPPESQRAETQSQLCNEKPLIINPITENPIELFTLIFIQHANGKKTLELKPQSGLSEYPLQKAKETIKTFNLGYCDITTSHSVDSYRITTHSINYELFHKLALERDDKKKFTLTLKSNPKLKNYGFFHFIIHKKFEFKII